MLDRIGFALDNLYDRCLLLVFIVLFLAGGYAVYDSYLVYRCANDTSLLAYKPGYEPDPGPERELSDSMVGWIVIDGTKIDYPVMQGEDNTTYLNTDPYGEYSLSGSIFLDYRNASDFSDTYSLIYGHHMEYDAMFGALDAYLERGFLEGHTEGTLLLLDGTKRPFRMFAVLITDASEGHVFVPGEGMGTLDFVKEQAIYLTKAPSGDKPLLALSTCKYPDTAERTVVFAYFE